MWQLFLIWANWVIKQTWLFILSSLASLAWHMACILYVCWFLAATYQPGHDESHLITHRRLFTFNAGTNTCEQHLCPQATSTSIICPQATSTSIICPQATSTSIICPRPHQQASFAPRPHQQASFANPQALPPNHPHSTTKYTYTTRPLISIGPCSAHITNFGFYIPVRGTSSQDSVWSCEFAIPLVQWFVPRAHRPTIGVNACLFCLMMHCKDFNPPSQVLKRERQAEPILLLPPVISKQPVQMTESQFRVWLQI